MLLGPELLLDKALNLPAAVRGSRLVIVTVETAGITTGVYGLCGIEVLEDSDFGDAGDSMVGEAGDSRIGEAGDSIVGEAGDSTIVNGGASIIRREEGSTMDNVGESMSGESGGAINGESSPADFFQGGSYFSLVSDSLSFFLGGSSSSPEIRPVHILHFKSKR